MSGRDKIYKFNFYADVEYVSIALKFQCVLSVIWKRGNCFYILGEKSSEVKKRQPITNGKAVFNERLSLECNMNCD